MNSLRFIAYLIVSVFVAIPLAITQACFALVRIIGEFIQKIGLTCENFCDDRGEALVEWGRRWLK